MPSDAAASLLGAGSDAIRRRNLSALLTLVHRSRGLSRSQLTQATALNRSTIAGLVAELVELELVTEGTPDGTARVGRPSPIVRPSDGVAVIAVSPEKDALTVALVGLGGHVLARRRTAVDRLLSADEVARLTADKVVDLRSAFPGVRILNLGVAVPGLVRAADGLVRLAPHLGWRDEPLGSMLQEATGLNVLVSNDAMLGATAESVFGAARGFSHAVYLNGGSSGIGGGIIANGAPLRGIDGYAGEFGHTHAGTDDKVDAAGVAGSLESEVTRAALLDLLGIGPVDADTFESALLAANDPAVTAEADRQLDFVATTLGTVVNILNPEVIVLGGFLAALQAARPGRLEALLATRALDASREGVRIRRAELGSDLLLIGGAELAFTPLLNDPAATGSPLTDGQPARAV